MGWWLEDTETSARAQSNPRRLMEGDNGVGQTGSFPFFEVSSHYEPSESCETNIRKRPVCPRVPVCTFSTFKPKYLVFPCLISRCTEKSYVFPFLASSPKSSDGLWMANATTAPTVKLVAAVTTTAQ